MDDDDAVVEPDGLDPRLPAVLMEEPVDEPDVDPVDAPDVLPVDPAEMLSPEDRLATDATVPLVGAYSLVLLSAVWAVLTLASAVSTAACAVAMLEAEVVLDVVLEPELEELDPPLLELVLVDDPDSAELSWSWAAVSCDSAWSSASCAFVGSSVATSWPLLTCWPTVTSTAESVPLIWKFTLSLVPAWMLPLPVTVDWTTPFWALTTWVEVRAELGGGPIWVRSRASSATASAASTYRCHGRSRRALLTARFRGSRIVGRRSREASGRGSREVLLMPATLAAPAESNP